MPAGSARSIHRKGLAYPLSVTDGLVCLLPGPEASVQGAGDQQLAVPEESQAGRPPGDGHHTLDYTSTVDCLHGVVVDVGEPQQALAPPR